MAFAWPVCATAGQIELGVGLAQPGLNPTFQPWAVGTTLRFGYQHPLAPRWAYIASVTHQRFLNDTSSTSTIKFSFPNDHADQRWQLWALDMGAQYYLTDAGSLRPYMRGTLGANFWDVKYLNGDAVTVTSGSGGRTDFSAQEVAMRGAFGVVHTAGAVGFALEVEGTYLTGLGADFSDATNDMRSHAILGLQFRLSYELGHSSGDIKVSSEPQPTGAAPVVVSEGEKDSDQDGVPDFVDRCANTPRAAQGWVDVEGCLLDSDKDGVADYLDSCRGSDARWPVDSTGCVKDSDGDGVPDSEDRCSRTPAGERVNSSGCPDYPPLKDTVVLRFDYAPGATQLKGPAQAQLELLVPQILYNPSTKISICGYTDNVGFPESNLALAQKRAQVVKEFLMSKGIPASQLIATGKGEAHPIASNNTAEGRKLNRRIEIAPAR